MQKFVLDTNVLIHAMRSESAQEELAVWQRRMAPNLYHHAVVAAELLAGAGDDATWRRWHAFWIAPAERVGRVVTPGYGAWLHATRIVARLVELGQLTRGAIHPSFFNDCLLAAGAHRHGYTIITHNTADFARIGLVEPGLRYLPPLP